MIKVDESDPVGEVDPSFAFRDVQIRRGDDVKKYYDLEGEIGRGKFGIVYKCRDKETKLILAAKFVSIAKRQDRKNVEREVEIMRTLRHPRLIQLYDAFENDSTMCVVLELIEGGELFERVIDDDFILTEKACTVFMRQICEGVAFIHSNNVIHLDLKPENILCLTKTGNRIKIIDFGLARKFEPDKKLQVLFGTPEFVAPEVVNFDQISCATDMWSVGVICYVLLSGLSPFMGESDIETMSNVTLGKYDFDDEAFDDISATAKDFISQLLVKCKEKRLTGLEALKHPWLYRKIPPPPPSLDTTKENLKNYLETTITTIPENNKLANRKSMLNAIQILADSEKQFSVENNRKAFSVAENEPSLTDILKPVRSELITPDKPDVNETDLINSLNSVNNQGQKLPNGIEPPTIEEPVMNVGPQVLSKGKLSPEITLDNKSKKTEGEELVAVAKVEPPTIKRESPLPDTLASLVPIKSEIPLICETAALLSNSADNQLKLNEDVGQLDPIQTLDLISKVISSNNLEPMENDSLLVKSEEKSVSNVLSTVVEERQQLVPIDETILNNREEKKTTPALALTPTEENVFKTEPEINAQKDEPQTEQLSLVNSLSNISDELAKTREEITKPAPNMETILPKLNETLANLIQELPPPIVHEKPREPLLALISSSPITNSAQTITDNLNEEGVNNLLCTSIPIPLSVLEKRCSIPTPLSLLDKVKIEDVIPKPSNLDNPVQTSPSSITEILQNTLGSNITQKFNLGMSEKEDKMGIKDSKKAVTEESNCSPLPPERGSALGTTLNQNPHPKILGITLGQNSLEESSRISHKSFSSQSSSTLKFKLFEESSESSSHKTCFKKESSSKMFTTKEHETEKVTFKQHLKSSPPWFSESKTLNSKTEPLSDRRSDISSMQYAYAQNESSESIWSNHINQLSARLLEMSNPNRSPNEMGENSSGDKPGSGENPIGWFLNQNRTTTSNNATRRPKLKFSMMNRDVPIGSPPQEGGREFYLNRPLIVVPGSEKTPQTSRLSPDVQNKNESQCWQNSCQSSILKMVTSEEREKHFTSESKVNNLSAFFKTNSKS